MKSLLVTPIVNIEYPADEIPDLIQKQLPEKFVPLNEDDLKLYNNKFKVFYNPENISTGQKPTFDINKLVELKEIL
jgi:hypothetical protein